MSHHEAEGRPSPAPAPARRRAAWAAGAAAALGIGWALLARLGRPARGAVEARGAIDSFMPRADVRESHEILIRAPADAVFAAAERQEVQRLPVVSAIFWLRGRLLGAREEERELPRGLVAETRALGWRELARRPGRELVMGAAAQPWHADPGFTPIAPADFLAYAEPDRVKIVWTLEAEPLGPMLTRFRTRTRVMATDAAARRRFRRYWLAFGPGVLLIRRLMLRALRREVEHRVRAVRRARTLAA